MVPGVDAAKMDPKNVRQVVDYTTGYPPGTIVVDPYARFLYLMMENGKAMRYGVGVAKAGMEFVGEADISRKAQRPGWVPTQNMIKREPDRYGPLAAGLEGGIKNPLGARALYLYQGGKDTLYRIHGTNEPWTIGRSVNEHTAKISGLLDRNYSRAMAFNFAGTPSFVIGRTTFAGVLDEKVLKDAIGEARAARADGSKGGFGPSRTGRPGP